MNICIVTRQYDVVLTGPGLYTKNLVKLLCNDGHTVTLVGPVTELLQWSSSNLKIETLGSKKLSQSKVGWMILAFLFARKLRKLEQSGKYDVIHFTDAREALFSSTEKRLVIGNVNDTYIADRKVNPFYYKKYYPADWVIRWAYYNMMYPLEKKTLKRLQINICNSLFTHNAISRSYSISSKRSVVCYKSVDISLYRNLVPHNDKYTKPQILFMGGRNAQRKGLASLFEAAPKVLQALPTAEFLVVGDDPVIGNLTKRIAPDILSKFRFINWVSNADMPQYYQRASVLVMPSLVEAFGVVAIEAMASGTAVIATNNGGTTEFIDDGVNGVLIQPKDHEGLSEKIILLLRDTRLRDVVIDNGKATAASFNVEKMKKETYKIYNLASETS